MKMKASPLGARLVLILALVLAGLPAQSARAAGTRRYARPYGPADGPCTSWATACDLVYALSLGQPGDDLWVQQGIYTPDASDRNASFVLTDGVAVHGGFLGTETKLSQAKPGLNVTVLSGDIGVAGDSSDNSYKVVRAQNVGSSTLLDGFTIAAGAGPGMSGAGLFLVSADLTLRRLTIIGNSAADGGGVYAAGGAPRLTHITLIGNSATANGGGLAFSSSAPTLSGITFIDNAAADNGGGMFTSADVNAKHLTFTGNMATNGGGIYASGGTLSVSSASFHANAASGHGGGMYASGGSVSFSRVTFSGNSSDRGGGIFNDGGNLSLVRVVFASNIADTDGGGMFNTAGTSTLTDISFVHNSAGAHGGGLDNDDSTLPLRNVTFSTNSATYGGGLANYNHGNAHIVDATFHGNSAAIYGGAIYDDVTSGPSLWNVTISGNSATTAGDGFFQAGGSALHIYDSISWANGAGEIINTGGSSATIADSLLKGGCPADPSFSCDHVIKGNPLLGPLANNGGFTKTMALGIGSPAIDAGKNSTCAAKDQRGVTRPQGLRCDMGAYEFVP